MSKEYDEAFVDGLRMFLARPPEEKLTKGVCRFNHNVDCPAVGNHCGKCGWNPAVAEIRTQKIRKRLADGSKKKD